MVLTDNPLESLTVFESVIDIMCDILSATWTLVKKKQINIQENAEKEVDIVTKFSSGLIIFSHFAREPQWLAR